MICFFLNERLFEKKSLCIGFKSRVFTNHAVDYTTEISLASELAAKKNS
jgi:hypothetical protein